MLHLGRARHLGPVTGNDSVDHLPVELPRLLLRSPAPIRAIKNVASRRTIFWVENEHRDT